MNNDRTEDFHYLADGYMVSFDSRKTGTNNNVMVVGTNGCGKTMSVVEPMLLHTRNHSIIVSLSKRSLFDRYGAAFESKGYKVIDLNLARAEESSHGYDPLACVKTDADIMFLADAIVPESGKNADPYWRDNAMSVITAEMACIVQKARREGRKPRFEDVLALHRKNTAVGENCLKLPLDDIFRQERNINPDNLASRCWKAVEGLPGKTMNTVLSTLNSAMDKIFTPETEAFMKKEPQLDIPAIGDERTAVFITTSAVNSSMHRFIDLFYGDVFKILFEHAEEDCRGGILPVPVHLVCDDFACGSTIRDFSQYISIFRAKGISVTLLLQAESQLTSMYGQYDAATIINNCDTYVYMGGMDPETCRSIAMRTDRGLDEIMYMPIENVVVLRRGSKPCFSRRYQTENDEEYRELTEKQDERSWAS